MAPPGDVQILIPQTCECVRFHGKGDFAGGIKFSALNGEIIRGYLDGPNVITRVLKRDRGRERRYNRSSGRRAWGP